MVDRITPAQRSENMRRIRGKNTIPEKRVRSALFRFGWRFRLHRKDLPGTPDLVFVGLRKVIFVHGCYWHGHRGCKYAKLPQTNRAFWRSKIHRNQVRDRAALRTLKQLGWKSLVVWTCELRRHDRVQWRDVRFFLGRR